MSILDRVKQAFGVDTSTNETEADTVPRFTMDDLPNASASSSANSSISGLGTSPAQFSYMDGDKFPGGFGVTELWLKDYWTLRQRSSQLFENNLYARGLIRRLITNEINTGLTLEAFPEESILGYEDGALDEWSENTENRFKLWANNPEICDYYRRQTFWQIQAAARREALITGDVLVIMRQDERTQLPVIQIVPGDRVRTPMNANASRRNLDNIYHGVELDASGRQVAYHINTDEDKQPERVPAYGPRTGRRMAWMVYGTDKRHGAVRGDPLLSIILQSLKELDRYRDSAQRKAVINSILAMFIQKNSDKMGTRPLTGAGTRRDAVVDRSSEGEERKFNMVGQVPGLVMEELQEGETPQAFGHQGIDINFPEFEGAVVRAIAWANEVPPEILQLGFSNNYSASQAAINEFKMYLNRVRRDFGNDFCQPVYADWLLSEVLLQRIDAPGFLSAWRDLKQYDVYSAWLGSDWVGSIKPSTDMLKQVNAQGKAVDRGFTTHSRATSEITGMSFNRNVKRLRRENEQMVKAKEPLREAEAAQERETQGGGDNEPENPRTDSHLRPVTQANDR